jgi:hypothetical protein
VGRGLGFALYRGRKGDEEGRRGDDARVAGH